MKRILAGLAGVSALCLALPAYAADIDVTDPGYDWSGIYIGIQGGYGFGKSDIDDDVSFATDFNIDGAFAGGLLGVQWQLDPVLIGLEGEWNWSDIDGDDSLIAGFTSVDTDVKWFGSADLKLGLPMDHFLFYAIGGLAFGRLETGQDVPPLGAGFDDDQTDIGWTAGAGIDFAATDNFIIGARYKYFDFGDEDYDGGPGFTDRHQDVHFHTISLNMDYKFGM